MHAVTMRRAPGGRSFCARGATRLIGGTPPAARRSTGCVSGAWCVAGKANGARRARAGVATSQSGQSRKRGTVCRQALVSQQCTAGSSQRYMEGAPRFCGVTRAAQRNGMKPRCRHAKCVMIARRSAQTMLNVLYARRCRPTRRITREGALRE